MTDAHCPNRCRAGKEPDLGGASFPEEGILSWDLRLSWH